MKTFKLSFSLQGQCASGKNNVIVTRSGHRFPSKRFSLWKKNSESQAQDTLKISGKPNFPIDYPVSVTINYWSEDRRRRDVPGMIDALWHLIEHLGFIKDDQFLGGFGERTLFINHGLDREHPRTEVEMVGRTDNPAMLQEEIRTRGLMKRTKQRRKKQ
jgi:Holliday junction resolvase RusA-like endonuclease